VPRRICIIELPIAKTIIPKAKIPAPTPTNIGNPLTRVLAAVSPPTMNSSIPPNIHIIKMIPQMTIDFLDEIV
jgi:hypothetical protein